MRAHPENGETGVPRLDTDTRVVSGLDLDRDDISVKRVVGFLGSADWLTLGSDAMAAETRIVLAR